MGRALRHYDHIDFGYDDAAALSGESKACLSGNLYFFDGLCGVLASFFVNDKRLADGQERIHPPASFFRKTKNLLRLSQEVDASGGIRTHTGVSPTDFESVTSASSITLAHHSLLDYHTQNANKSQVLK